MATSSAVVLRRTGRTVRGACGFSSSFRTESRVDRAQLWSWQIDAAGVIQLPKLLNLQWTDRHSKLQEAKVCVPGGTALESYIK
jgi:hypothetical protein